MDLKERPVILSYVLLTVVLSGCDAASKAVNPPDPKITISNVQVYDPYGDDADWLYYDVVAEDKVEIQVEGRFFNSQTFTTETDYFNLQAGELKEGLMIPDGPAWDRVKLTAKAKTADEFWTFEGPVDCEGCNTYRYADLSEGEAH